MMKHKLIIALALVVFTMHDLFAQVPILPTDDGNVEDVPIQFLIYPLLMLGAYLGYKQLKNKG